MSGGLQVSLRGAVESTTAFFFFSVVTEIGMRTVPLRFRPFAGPAGQGLQQDWEDVHSAATTGLHMEAQAVTAERIDTALLRMHCTLCG